MTGTRPFPYSLIASTKSCQEAFPLENGGGIMSYSSMSALHWWQELLQPFLYFMFHNFTIHKMMPGKIWRPIAFSNDRWPLLYLSGVCLIPYWYFCKSKWPSYLHLKIEWYTRPQFLSQICAANVFRNYPDATDCQTSSAYVWVFPASTTKKQGRQGRALDHFSYLCLAMIEDHSGLIHPSDPTHLYLTVFQRKTKSLAKASTNMPLGKIPFQLHAAWWVQPCVQQEEALSKFSPCRHPV